MADDYAQEIQKRIDALPPAVRDLVYSADMGAIIRTIGAKHQLHVDQIGALETEAAAVMIGLSEAKDFVSEVAENLNVDTAKATAIVNDVNTQLFVKIQDAMKRGGPAGSASVPVQKTPVTTPAFQPTPVASVSRPVTLQTPPPIKPTSIPAMTPPPAAKPAEIHPADLMLSQKTVTVAPIAPKPAAPAPATPPQPPATSQNQAPAPAIPAKPEPPAPKPYTADPYREPVE